MTVHAAYSDQSDDEVMQQLALAANAFKRRFGGEQLISCLSDLSRCVEAAEDDELNKRIGANEQL